MGAAHRTTALAGVALLLLAGAVRPAGATEVAVEVSPRQAYVGVPIVVRISIDYSRDYEPPAPPQVKGLDLVGRSGPNQSNFTVNGRVIRQSAGFVYQFVATEPGEFTIPSMDVLADGQTFTTEAIRVTASLSPNDGLLRLDVVSERQACYLGEQIELTLEVWLRPYRSDRFRVQLDEHEMLQCVDVQGSSWGVFQTGLDGKSIRVRRDTAPDAGGSDREYYVYLIPGVLTPQQTGPLSFEDVRVLVNYPTEIRESRRLFSRGAWDVVEARPVVAVASRTPISIKPPPAEGQPPWFDGAVGSFSFHVAAAPTSVAVGDPITLTMTIVDQTRGGNELELLKPPPLERQAELTANFRIPTDPLAGTVQNRRKTFTQTIRARNDGVTRIPPIRFSYFDPDNEQYVTLSSDEIPVEVTPAATLSISEIVGGRGAAESGPTELTELAGGILANDTGPELLRSHRTRVLSAARAAAIAAPPLLFAVLLVGRRHARRRGDAERSRWRRAGRHAARRLSEAGSAPQGRQAETTAAAISDYVADRCNLPAGTLTRDEVVRRLRDRGVAADLLGEVESLLADCERLRYAGDGSDLVDSIAGRAALCLKRLERARIK